MPEQTLVLLKPDAVQRGLVGEIIRRFEAKGFIIAAIKMLRFNKKLTQDHYGQYEKEPFYPTLSKFTCSGPSVALVVEGENAIEIVRLMMGATSPLKSEPGTIRGDFSHHVTWNVIHGSDSAKTAKSEIRRFFSKSEIFSRPKSGG